MYFPLRLTINNRLSLFLALILLCSSVSAGEVVGPMQDYPQDMLILKFAMGQSILLAENIIAYPNMTSTDDGVAKDSIALSFGEFVNALEFSITLDSASGEASGWFVEKSHLFELDLSQGTVTIKGLQQSINPQHFQWYEDDIFVDLDTLSAWFDFSFNYHSNRQLLDLSAKQIMPFQQKWARESKREKINQWVENNADEAKRFDDLPLFVTPFALLSVPQFSLSSNLGYQTGNESNSQLNYQYNGYINHDLLYHDANWFYKGNQNQDFSELRFSLGRLSEMRDLSGIGLSEYSIGDNYSYAMGLVSNSVAGTGIVMNGFDLGFRTQDNAVTLRGDSHPGWDIELYRNDALFNASSVKDDGTYEFVDVPLTSGVNEVKLVFYGPRGEKEQKIQHFYMHPDLARTGEFNWRASVHRQRDALFDTQPQQTNESHGKNRLVLQGEYGMTANLSLTGGWVDMVLPKLSQRQQYLSLGSRFTFGGSYFAGQYVQQVNRSSRALQLFTSSEFEQLSVNGRYQYFSEGYVSEKQQLRDQQAGDNRLRSLSSMNLFHNFESDTFNHVSVGFKATLEQNHDGSNSLGLSTTQALASGSLSMTNDIKLDQDIIDGALVFNLPPLYDWKLRGNLQYNLNPKLEVSAFSLSGEYRLGPQYFLKTRFDQLFGKGRSTRLGLRLVRQFDGFNLDLATQYQSGGQYQLTLNLSFNFQGFDLRKAGESTMGHINAKVFLDNNSNKRFDSGDTPLPKVHFSVNGRAVEQVTQKSGKITLTTPANRRSVVKISPGVFDDYYWDVQMPQRAVITRAGKPMTLEFAAQLNGEIEGMVFIQDEHGPSLSDVSLELVDLEDKVVATTESGFDGFYLFEKVPFGQYRVRISQAQLKQLKFAVVKPQTVSVSKKADIVSGIDFYLSLISTAKSAQLTPCQ